jgi:hypothetical protein
MILGYSFQKELSVKKLISLPRMVLARTHNGAKSPISLEYTFAIDLRNIYLGVFNANQFQNVQKYPKESFVEGLWEQDVIELFLRDDTTENYQELQLSPSGAWWTSAFSAPRVKMEYDFTGTKAKVTSGVDHQDEWVVLTLSRDTLKINCSFSNDSYCNICACIGDKERHYLSATSFPGAEPNFHQPAFFSPMLMLTCY